MSGKRVTDEHWFWIGFWGLALCLSLFWDTAVGQPHDGWVTLIDVTSFTLSLVIACRIGMRWSTPFRCGFSLAVYFVVHWVRDWLLLLVLGSFLLLPMMMSFSQNAIVGAEIYVGVMSVVPTVLLIRNIGRLGASPMTGERWRFETTPRWLVRP